MTPVHGVREYDVYIYAMSEDQAKTSWMDIYNILEDNKKTMSKFFYWTKEKITNLNTRSSLYFCTSSAKTKDGQRPGAISFDEYHAYESMKLVNVAETGLGKKKFSRKTIITTNGLVRGGPYDMKLEEGKAFWTVMKVTTDSFSLSAALTTSMKWILKKHGSRQIRRFILIWQHITA
jgi:Phage terminase-like protein, large subunit